MKRIIRLTESDLTRIVRKVINEMYDVGSTIELTKGGKKIKYSIETIETLNGKFGITLKDTTTGKMESYDDRTLNALTDIPFKNGILAIRKNKLG